MTTKGLSGGYLSRIRAPIIVRPSDPQAANDVTKPEAQTPLGPGAIKERAPLGPLSIPESVAGAHRDALAQASTELVRIHACLEKLEPWRAKAFDRLLDTYFKLLGKALDDIPSDRRGEAAKAWCTAFAGLVERAGDGDHLASAVSCALAGAGSALRLSARRQLELDPSARAALMKNAVSITESAIGALETRVGLSKALSILPVIAEQLEAAEGKALTVARRQDLWKAALGFVASSAPLSGVDLEINASLAKALSDARTADPKKSGRKLLDDAARRVLAQHKPALADLIRHLETPVAGLEELSKALAELARAHPAGPERLYRAIYELHERARAEGGDPAVWSARAALISRFAKTELAERALELAPSLSRPAGNSARELAQAISGPDHPALSGALDAIRGLESPRDLAVVFGIAGALQRPDHPGLPGAIAGAIRLAKSGGRDDLPAAIHDRVARELTFFDALARVNAGGVEGKKLGQIAAALASTAAVDPGEEGAGRIARMIRDLGAQYPGVRIEDLIRGRAGLWTLADPTQHYRGDPETIFTEILAALDRAGLRRSEPAAQTAALARAIELTALVARLDGDYKIPFRRILADFETIAKDPGEQLAPRAAKKKDLAAALESLPGIAPELVPTALVHLSADQLAWLTDRTQNAKGRDTRRALRDLVLGAVSAERLDLLDALRETKAPAKALSKTIAFVARAFREDTLHDVSFDRLVENLRADRDPIAAIEQERGERALKELGLDQALGGKVDPAGIAVLNACAPAIASIKEAIDGDVSWDGTNASALREPFLEVLRSVGAGTWPATKYQSEAGRRTLAFLDEQQRTAWRNTLITARGAEAKPGEQLHAQETVALLQGVARAVRKSTSALAKVDASAEGVRVLQEKLAASLETLRKPKGTTEHAEAARSMRALRDQLAMARFLAAIDGAVGRDPRAALEAMKDVLGDAISALRSMGLKAGAAVVKDAIQLAATSAPANPKQGMYAIDEDGLEPSFMSASGGCCHYASERRWANIACAANANEKVIRVYDNDRFVYRAFVKVYEGEIGDYQGPILWLNAAQSHGGGSSEHRELLLEHAIQKAQLLGIPLVTLPSAIYCVGNDASAAAEKAGLEQVLKRVTVHFPADTATGWTFVDYWTARNEDHSMKPGTTYNHDLRKAAEGGDRFTASFDDLRVVFPRARA